jgi:hypothetical protein
MMKRLLLVGLALSALGVLSAAPASADQSETKTVVALSQAATAPPDNAPSVVPATVWVEQEGQTGGESLPQTSSMLTLIVLIGCVGICLVSLLKHFRRPLPVANR